MPRTVKHWRCSSGCTCASLRGSALSGELRWSDLHTAGNWNHEVCWGDSSCGAGGPDSARASRSGEIGWATALPTSWNSQAEEVRLDMCVF